MATRAKHLAELKWDEDNARDNLAALQQVRRHMPVAARRMTVQELVEPQQQQLGDGGVNGRLLSLPMDLAKRFQRTNVLTYIRVNPANIERMHPSTLESLRVTGLTLTERRALHAHLKETGAKWKKQQPPTA